MNLLTFGLSAVDYQPEAAGEPPRQSDPYGKYANSKILLVFATEMLFHILAVVLFHSRANFESQTCPHITPTERK